MKQPTNLDYNPTYLEPNTMDKLQGLMDNLKTKGLNTWWGLPKPMQDMLQKLTKGKKTWTTTLYKMYSGGDWYLSLPLLLTYNESLTGGTEKTLDKVYEQLTGKTPSDDSKMLTTWSSNPLPNGNCTLTYQGDDELWPESSYYLCEETQTLCWLCPYLQWLMGEKPKTLYLELKPTK
jgi:hypothetical protein